MSLNTSAPSLAAHSFERPGALQKGGLGPITRKPEALDQGTAVATLLEVAWLRKLFEPGQNSLYIVLYIYICTAQ